MMRKSSGSRIWIYFRVGWITYFGFIFAAANTLITTYFLLIENVQFIKEIFPTFEHYVISVSLLAIPVLTVIGYVHFQRSQAFKVEADTRTRSNLHELRILLNTEIILAIIFRLHNLYIKKLNNERLMDDEFQEITTMQEMIQDYQQHRTVTEIILTDIDKITKKL
jgi:hypothetical protein